VLPDGSLQPCGQVESAAQAPAVVIPDEFGRSLAFDRETVDIQTGQHIEQGETPARARELAITAARRIHGGQPGRPYTQRS
jgi:hypothetical protein